MTKSRFKYTKVFQFYVLKFCIFFYLEAVSSQHADTKDIQLHSFIGEWFRQAGVLNIRTEKKKVENLNKTL